MRSAKWLENWRFSTSVQRSGSAIRSCCCDVVSLFIGRCVSLCAANKMLPAHSRTTISCGMFMVVLTTTSLHVSVLLSAFQHQSLALRDLRSYQAQTSHSEASPARPSIHDPSLLILDSTLDSLHMQLDVDRTHFKYCQCTVFCCFFFKRETEKKMCF